MADAKQTPGPWVSGVIGTSEADTTIAYVRSEASSPIEALNGSPDIALVTGEANARLIAGAPDLKAGCEGLLGLCTLLLARDDLPPDVREALQNNHRVAEARAAIAKSEGAA